jgi:hypothetical protein
VDQQVVEQLRSEEHDVIYIAEAASGMGDEEVFTLANQARAGLSQERKANSVAAVFREYGGELEGAFAVIEPARVRIRRGR